MSLAQSFFSNIQTQIIIMNNEITSKIQNITQLPVRLLTILKSPSKFRKI